MQNTEDRGVGKGLVFGGLGAAALATTIAAIATSRPVKAAPTDEKLDYLIEVLTALLPLLAEVSERQATLIVLFEQWLAAQGIPGVPAEGIEVIVSTPWVAQEPVELFDREVREAAVTLDCDKMADYRRGKRIIFKVESSLDQTVHVQIVGNIEDSMTLATNLNAAHPVAPNGNITVGLAWDDWHPFVGARIIVGAAPTTGRLKVEYSIQE
ncbi:hypothetical protein ES703_73990 [subsurface metagenome]